MLSVGATVVFIFLVGTLPGKKLFTFAANPWSAARLAPSQKTPLYLHKGATLEQVLASPTPLHGFLAVPGALRGTNSKASAPKVGLSRPCPMSPSVLSCVASVPGAPEPLPSFGQTSKRSAASRPSPVRPPVAMTNAALIRRVRRENGG